METADGRRVEEPDPRTHGQRMHDALEAVCDRLLRSDGLSDSGGTPATVIVTIDLQDLLDKTGYAVTGDGTLIPTSKALAAGRPGRDLLGRGHRQRGAAAARADAADRYGRARPPP